MSKKVNSMAIARKTLVAESKAIAALEQYLTEDFNDAVEAIYQANGRLIITGIGKSANIATKMVATFNSTGTPAIFMHAADAIHGDLGTILEDDIVLCLSKSGNTPEIKVLIPLIKNAGNTIIALCGNPESYLVDESDFFINSFVEEEACPNNLAPTTSTTAQLVLGDALAISLLEKRGFDVKDFAKYHPGGSLGKRLYLRVRDLMIKNQKPLVKQTDYVKDVIFEISSKRRCVSSNSNSRSGLLSIRLISLFPISCALNHSSFFS